MATYKDYIDVYYQWYKATVGVPPRINAVEGKALKAIISYYTTLCDKDEVLALASWQATLKNWDALPPFYKQQKDLKQINSNINAIIRSLKNARKNGVSDDYRAQVLRDLQS